MNVITTWMYTSGRDENIKHSQIGESVASIKAQNYYWRCVFLLFKSSFEHNKNYRHILFLNKMPPDEIDGVRTQVLIDKYNIEIVEFENLTLSPKDYYLAWNTQFLILDVLDWLNLNTEDDDNIFILDSDIIINKEFPEELILTLNKEKLLTYNMNYPQSHVVNGLNQNDLNLVAKSLNEEVMPLGDIEYSGGEIVCCKGSELEKVAIKSREVYLKCLELHKNKKTKFNEEAHLLSYVYHFLGYDVGGLNPYIKRIWTDARNYRNVNGAEKGLVFLHLPDQKKTGYVKLFSLYNSRGINYRVEDINLFKIMQIDKSAIRLVLEYTVARVKRIANIIRRKVI